MEISPSVFLMFLKSEGVELRNISVSVHIDEKTSSKLPGDLWNLIIRA